MAYSVSIVLDAYDNASKVFDKVESRLTTMQQRINSQFAVPARAEFAQQIQKQFEEQFEARGPLEDELFNLTHSAKERELRDSDRYFGELRTKWADNQGMLTMISQTEAAKRKSIEEQYMEHSLAFVRKYRHQVMDVMKSAMVAGMALKVFEAFTGAAVAYRDKGPGEALLTFVNTIPIIGSSLVKSGENIAELITNSNAQIAQSNRIIEEQDAKEKRLNLILEKRVDLLGRINLLKAPTKEDRDQLVLDQQRDKAYATLKPVFQTASREHDEGLYRAAKETWNMVNELYLLELGEPARLRQQTAETEALNKAKQNQLAIEKEIEQAQGRIYELRFGKTAAETKQLEGKGASDEQLSRAKGLREIEEATISGQKANEDYAKTIKDMDDAINKHGYNAWQGKIFDAMEQGISADKLNEMLSRYNRIEQQRLGENTAPQDRGWNYTEGRFLSGRSSTAENYAERTAQNTEAQTKLLERIATYLERAEPQKVGNDLNIQSVDEGWA